MTSSTSIEIRQPTRTELSAVRQLRHAELVAGQKYSPYTLPTSQDLHPTSVHMVAFVDGLVVSAVRLKPLRAGSRTYIVSRMVTRDGFRGQGIGRRVLELGEAVARQRGAASFILHARPTAAGFYLKAGYLHTGEHKTGEFGSHNLVMTKPATP